MTRYDGVESNGRIIFVGENQAYSDYWYLTRHRQKQHFIAGGVNAETLAVDENNKPILQLITLQNGFGVTLRNERSRWGTIFWSHFYDDALKFANDIVNRVNII